MELLTSFIKATLDDEERPTHANRDVLKLLHEKAGLTANFAADFEESPCWTVLPSISATQSDQALFGTRSLNSVFTT